MKRLFRSRPTWLLVALLGFASARAASDALIDPAHRLSPDAPAWRELAARFRDRPDALASFEERRFFPFRAEPVVLRGEVRVSRERGLSLHYTAPEVRTIVIDEQGMLIREANGRAAAPPDPRASAANEALRHILRFDFSALEKSHEVYGRQAEGKWLLALVPRAAEVRRAIGDIFVTGEDTRVLRIELRRSARQHIDIAMTPVAAAPAFTAEEIKRYFR